MILLICVKKIIILTSFAPRIFNMYKEVVIGIARILSGLKSRPFSFFSCCSQYNTHAITTKLPTYTLQLSRPAKILKNSSQIWLFTPPGGAHTTYPCKLRPQFFMLWWVESAPTAPHGYACGSSSCKCHSQYDSRLIARHFISNASGTVHKTSLSRYC